MNALKVITNATRTPPATTPREDTTAFVKTDTLEVDKVAQVCFMTVLSILYVRVEDEIPAKHDRWVSKRAMSGN